MSEYLIREEDFEDDISRMIFKYRKAAYENHDYAYVLKLVCRMHNWIVDKIHKRDGISLEETVAQIAKESCPFVIFGAGYSGGCTFERLREGGMSDRVAFFCDSDSGKQHKSKNDVEIISPEELLLRKEEYAVLLPASVYTEEMKLQLLSGGFPDEKIYIFPIDDLFTRHLRKRDDLEEIFFGEGNQFVLFGDALPEIIFGNLLRESKIPFTVISNAEKNLDERQSSIVRFAGNSQCYFICLNGGKTEQLMEMGIPEHRILQFTHELDEFQYFDPEVGSLHKQGVREVFIDGGSCDLNTSIRFLNWCNAECDKVYAFECDRRGVKLCQERLQRITKLSAVTELIPKGLWSEETTLHFFEASYVSGSNVTKNARAGTVDIETESIDHVLKGERATFIKMDIEGSELEALKGAEKTILKWHPLLAISLYHKLEDIVTIPSYIKSIVPEYKLYIRNYHEEYTETVLYAIYPEAAEAGA